MQNMDNQEQPKRDPLKKRNRLSSKSGDYTPITRELFFSKEYHGFIPVGEDFSQSDEDSKPGNLLLTRIPTPETVDYLNELVAAIQENDSQAALDSLQAIISKEEDEIFDALNYLDQLVRDTNEEESGFRTEDIRNTKAVIHTYKKLKALSENEENDVSKKEVYQTTLKDLFAESATPPLSCKAMAMIFRLVIRDKEGLLDHLNNSQNPKWDKFRSFFCADGEYKTNSWQSTIKDIRGKFLTCLNTEMSLLPLDRKVYNREKKALLKWAKEEPIIWMHRNNTIFHGTCRNTSAESSINEKLHLMNKIEKKTIKASQLYAEFGKRF